MVQILVLWGLRRMRNRLRRCRRGANRAGLFGPSIRMVQIVWSFYLHGTNWFVPLFTGFRLFGPSIHMVHCFWSFYSHGTHCLVSLFTWYELVGPSIHMVQVLVLRIGRRMRGRYKRISLIRNSAPLGPYSRTMPRAPRWSKGGWRVRRCVGPRSSLSLKLSDTRVYAPHI